MTVSAIMYEASYIASYTISVILSNSQLLHMGMVYECLRNLIIYIYNHYVTKCNNYIRSLILSGEIMQ